MEKRILVRLRIQKNVDQFLQAAKIMIEKTNVENGCLFYNLYQDAFTKSDFIFYEKFKDESAVEFHNDSEHFANFIKEITPILAEKPIMESF